MTIEKAWQLSFVEALRQQLVEDTAVLALVLFGSVAREETAVDVWSDVDVLLVTTDEGLASFFPDVSWLRPFGPLFALEQHEGGATCTTRLCFQDMRRADIVLLSQSNLATYEGYKFWQPGQIIFAKSPTVAGLLLSSNQTDAFSLPTTADFERMVNQFWYRGSIAVYKVMQDDLLIALHLTFELLQDCCVLAMMLRDRVEQTNHHRTGGIGNRSTSQLPACPEAYTVATILAMIAQTAVHFDELAQQWSADYEERRRPLLAWLQTIQKQETQYG